MSKLTFGVIGTSRKEDERRIAIHPEHLPRLSEPIRRQLIFEEGYGEQFGIEDSDIAAQTGGTATRHELLANIGMVIIPKPVLADLQELREGGVLWGWPHCVQQRALTQAAIDRKQTLIAFEDMFVWGPNDLMGRHTFYKNNEMAGYCAVYGCCLTASRSGANRSQRDQPRPLQPARQRPPSYAERRKHSPGRQQQRQVRRGEYQGYGPGHRRRRSPPGI